MAILSVSRRTDIPTFYGEWFINRLKAGSFITRNPFNQKASQVTFTKDDIDCIVFWTKNPIPFMKYLPEIQEYSYYFQFTVTGYGKDIEANLPDKERIIKAFQELHDKGNGHVIWRYDPIVFTETYTPEWHIQMFRHIAEKLRGYTDRCVISFVDMYEKYGGLADPLSVFSKESLASFCTAIAQIAKENKMQVFTCAEVVDLAACGIQKGKCIDGDYIERITGKVLDLGKDKGQRKACGCIESVEMGSYNTCRNGCKYCYACTDKAKLELNCQRYDPTSPILCDSLAPNEEFTTKALKAFGHDPEPEQLTLF